MIAKAGYPFVMRRVRTILFMLLSSPLISTIAIGATAPPEPSLRRPPATWVGYALMFVFLVIIISISLMSSKRGHQD